MRYKSLSDYSDITPFAQCPSCGRMIEIESFTDAVLADGRKCPFCYTFIEKKEIISSCEKYLKTTNRTEVCRTDIEKLHFTAVNFLIDVV